jgi:Cdc6-like AAA superfamily ATPase
MATTMKPSLSQIENAFQPAKEITEADRFAGRKTAVSDAYYALLADGTNLAIVGNRGIGKTSLARQVLNIGQGDNTLLGKLNLSFDQNLDFLSVYFACGSQVRNTAELLERLLTSTNCLSEWIYDVPRAKKVLSSYTPKFSAKLFGVGADLEGKRSAEVESAPAAESQSIDLVFTNVLHAVVDAKIARDGVLIVVDEFDQIVDVTGFASFLKALATNVPKVKFCIVGVGKDIQVLIKEHASVDRLFAGTIIPLPSMSSDELKEIIGVAERQVNGYINFSAAATERLVSLAQGHPYMIHLIGKYALRHAYHQNKREVTDSDVDATLRSLAERQVDPVLEGKYRKAVGSSGHRETVLRALAEAQDEQGEIFTSNAYKSALDGGVDNASQYVGQLVTEEYGAELEKLRERFYRFRDSLFAAYIRARPRMFPVEGK